MTDQHRVDSIVQAAMRRQAEQILADAMNMRPKLFVYHQPPVDATETTNEHGDAVYTITTLPEERA